MQVWRRLSSGASSASPARAWTPPSWTAGESEPSCSTAREKRSVWSRVASRWAL